MQDKTNVLGTNVERIDAYAKATGSANFTVDISVPEMQEICFIRSPWAYASIKTININGALDLDGVAGIITHSDMEGILIHNDPLDKNIRYLGEAVVGIAAKNKEVAEKALELVEVEYEVLPPILSPEDALTENAPPIWGGGNVCTWQGPKPVEHGYSAVWEKGDVEAALKKSDVVADCHLFTHAQFHGCLEPHSCVARWQPAEKEITMWISSQGIFDDQANIAKALGLHLDQVHVIATYVGGGFGAKAHNTCKEYIMTALLSKQITKPIRYVPSRSEEIIAAMRHPAEFEYKVGANSDGRITAIYMNAIKSGGAHTSLQMNFLAGSTDYVAPTYLKSENVKYEGISAYTTLPLCAAFRGFGYFESGIAFAQALDKTVEKLGIDPIDFLIKNVPERGDLVGTDQGPLTTGGIADTIKECAKRIQWKEKWHKPGMKIMHDGRYHGIAVAHAMGRATLPDFVTSGNAMIQVKMDGTAHLYVGISDIGQGQATGLAQIAAEALGIQFENIKVVWGDTVAPHTGDQVASSTTMMTGNPTKLAALDAKKQILDIASGILKTSTDKLDIQQGIISSNEDSDISISIAEIVQMPGVKVIVGNGHWSISDKDASPRSLVVCIAEVAVDKETGKIEVINMLQGTECGRVICQTRIDGQLDAVLSGGIGYILTEDWIMDKRDQGRILNLNMYDYKMPTFLDTADILQPNVIMEDPDPKGPFGARGMGEASLSASAPAILNAVYNAIGIRFNSTPLTPARVLNELKQNK